MRTPLHLDAIPFRPPSRGVAIALVAIAGLTAALVTWHGTLFAAAVPVVAFLFGVVVFVMVRRALRRASALIDTILREELGPPESRPENRTTAKHDTYR